MSAPPFARSFARPFAPAWVLALLLVAVAAPHAAGQGAAQNAAERNPRFLRIGPDAAPELTAIDPGTEPLLSRRIALRFREVTRVRAIQQIADAADIRFVYAVDLFPRSGPEAGDVGVNSASITVAAALTAVLRDAGVDVALGANGSVVLVKKPRPPEPVAVKPVDEAPPLPSAGYRLAPVVTVTSAESRRAFDLQPSMGKLQVGVRELNTAPQLFEGDILRAAKLLPGVEAKNDYSAGLNVRGGESDQNLILLDGYPIYNPFHLGGLLGTFIDPLVGKVDLLTGAQPVQYGERLSSVLDVRSAEENRAGLHGAADISLLAATASVGSVFEGGGSWMVGARHTYADLIANAIKRNSLPYGFSDFQAHLTRPVFGNAVLSVTAYSGSDGATVSKNESGLDVGWGNHLIGATLSRVMPAPRRVLGVFPVDSVSLVQRLSLTVFDARAIAELREFALVSTVHDARTSGAVTLYAKTVDQSAGYELSAQHVNYSMRAPISSFTNFLPMTTVSESLTPVSGWYDLLWHGNPRLLVDAGVRVDALGGLGWTGASPRVSLKYFLTKQLALVAATGSYAQWMHSLVQDDAPVQPIEFWAASDKSIPVSRAWQSSLGVESWPSSLRQVRIEAFYKKYSNLVEVNPTADASVGDNPFEELSGRSYGVDLLVRQLDNGRFGGWIAYSFALSERTTPAGVTFSPGHDRRHALNAVGTWTGTRYRVSMRLGLSTGTPYTPIVGQFTRLRYSPLGNTYASDIGGGDVQYLPGATNSARLPFEHRLDVSLTKISHSTGVQVSPYISIANAYAQNNPAVYFYDYAQTKVVARALLPNPERLSISNLPFLPTIGVHIVY